MTNLLIIKHCLFAFSLFLVSAVISLILIKRIKILDIPNGRSSHTKPTPTIGGVAIVFTFFLSMTILYFLDGQTMIIKKYFLGFTFSSLLIAGISLYDDLEKKPFYIRLVSHALGAVVVMVFGIVINRINFPANIPFFSSNSLGAVSYIITFWWIVGMTNAYNFMDGINGMAGGNAIIASMFFCFISYRLGSNFTYIVSYTIAASVAGFLLFNFPRAKIFMGDVGSTFLGFTFATISIIAALYDNAHISLLVMPLLFFHFIYDTFFTFMRRLLNGENVFQAHTTHLYQLFTQLGHKHFVVTIFYYAIAILQGIGAIWMVKILSPKRLLVFLPYLAFQIIYTIIIIYFSKKKGLL